MSHRAAFCCCLNVVASLALLLLFPAGSGASEVGTTTAVDLFEHALPGPRTRLAAPGDEAIRTRRPVRVRQELLQAPLGVSAPLRFNLFPGAEFTAVTERDEATEGGNTRVLSGTLAGVPGSRFLLVVRGAEVVADVFVSPLERYQLRREPGDNTGAPEVRRLDPTVLPPGCAGTLPRSVAVRVSEPRPRSSAAPVMPQTRAAGDVTEADDPGTFDVLVAYTPAARVAAGGTQAIESLAGFAVAAANVRFQNSLITTRARLARAVEVPYTESPRGVFTDLERLISDAAGPLADVRAARDEVLADVACLFVAPPSARPPAGGFFNGAATFAVELGADGQPFGVPELAFSVVMPAFDLEETFPHEIGHNFGCQHDAENVVFQGVNYGPGIFPYSYGYRFYTAPGNHVRDVMAYEPGQAVPIFSNPRLIYAGVPAGTATADNARTINETAPLIANLRRATKVTVTATEPRAVEKPFRAGCFRLTRTGPTDRPLAVTLRVNSFSEPPIPGLSSLFPAEAGKDCSPLPEQVTFPAGSSTLDLPVEPFDDALPEGPERVRVIVQAGPGYVPASTPGADRASVIIRDTDTTVSVVAAAPVALRVPLTPGRFAFTRTGALDAALTINVRVTSTPFGLPRGSNYTLDAALSLSAPPPNATAFTLTFPPGLDRVEVALTPVVPAPTTPFGGSNLHCVAVQIEDGDEYKALLPTAGILILDQADARPRQPVVGISAPVPSVDFASGIAAGARARLDLVCTGPAGSSPSVNLALSGSAVLGVDYRLVREDGTNAGNGVQPYGVFFPPGQLTLPLFVVPYAPDDRLTKTIVVTVNPSEFGGHIVDPTATTATVTLLGTTPVLSVIATGPEARAASDLGPVNGEFTIRREGDLSASLTVRYAAAGNAVPGTQYKALSGVATFPAGLDFVRVKVKPRGNAGGPGVKSTVKLTLQPGEGYVLGSATKAKVKVLGGP